MLSYQLNQNVIEGEKTIIQNPTEAQRKELEKFDFEMHEVFAINVLISTGEGRSREKDAKISIDKKTDETYRLKMKNSLYEKEGESVSQFKLAVLLMPSGLHRIIGLPFGKNMLKSLFIIVIFHS